MEEEIYNKLKEAEEYVKSNDDRLSKEELLDEVKKIISNLK